MSSTVLRKGTRHEHLPTGTVWRIASPVDEDGKLTIVLENDEQTRNRVKPSHLDTRDWAKPTTRAGAKKEQP